MLSAQQLAQRREGITATDVAAIVGLHPYCAPIDIWLDKTGQRPPFAGNLRTKWGDLLEGPIRDDYAERYGVRVEVPGTLDHPELAWAKATPDGICYVLGRAMPTHGLEIKTHSFRAADWYGDPGTDQVPAHELIQCTWNMFITELDRWDLVAFVDGQPADYRITRDNDLIGMLREAGERFLVDNVRGGKRPEPDGSESYDRYLSTRFPHRTEVFIGADGRPDLIAKIDQLRAKRCLAGELEGEIDRLVQELKLVIGEDAGIEWTGADKKKLRITYRKNKDSTKTDWEAAYREVITLAQLAASVAHGGERKIDCNDALTLISSHNVDAHTSTTPGKRPFCVPRSWSKNMNKDD